VAALHAALEAAELDAVAVLPGPNLFYLTGLEFHLSERPIIGIFKTDGPVHFVLPKLEASKLVGAGFEPAAFVYDDETGPEAAVRSCMASARLGGRRCGVEERRMRFMEMDLLAHSGAGPALWGADAVFATLRTAKDADEIAAMRRAVSIAEAAYERVLPGLRPGVTERELAARLTSALLDAGSDPELPFFPIVASGENGALPHAVPSDRPFVPGDFVIVDWGARSGGYCSDITRTVIVAGAEPSAILRQAYQAVLEGNAAGRAAARSGATGHDVDAAARGVITEAGFGDAFVHRTGHGLGLETHEEPDMKSTNRAPLLPGATFTVEPGVYLEGEGGVRIEDDVLVTASGSESLTSLNRELVQVG
jgi:Xaa-Pro dipeptidase